MIKHHDGALTMVDGLFMNGNQVRKEHKFVNA